MVQDESRGALAYVAPVLRVADLARSVAFYRDQLGFELEFEYEGFYASLLRDGCRIHLKCAPPPGRELAPSEADEHLDACFVVSGADALSAQFDAAGAPFSVSLRTMPFGKEFYVRDPDGYVLGFVEAS